MAQHLWRSIDQLIATMIIFIADYLSNECNRSNDDAIRYRTARLSMHGTLLIAHVTKHRKMLQNIFDNLFAAQSAGKRNTIRELFVR